jgi:hypothetical protein
MRQLTAFLVNVRSSTQFSDVERYDFQVMFHLSCILCNYHTDHMLACETCRICNIKHVNMACENFLSVVDSDKLALLSACSNILLRLLQI